MQLQSLRLLTSTVDDDREWTFHFHPFIINQTGFMMAFDLREIQRARGKLSFHVISVKCFS